MSAVRHLHSGKEICEEKMRKLSEQPFHVEQSGTCLAHYFWC